MIPQRWTLAIEAGDLSLQGGAPVLVMGAQGDAELASLGTVQAVQGFAPDHERLRARGVDVRTAPEGRFSAALIQIVKSRAATLAATAEAVSHLPPGAPVLVDGQKELGIEAIWRLLRSLFDEVQVYSKAHGKLIWFPRPAELPSALADWIEPPSEVEGYLIPQGGFSADGPDRGSELLVALLPPLKGRVADLGAGWGYLAAEVLAEQTAITHLDLIEADWPMLEAARVNADDPRAAFHWTDVTRFAPAEKYDAIFSNPPFHAARRADPSLGRAFIAAAARLLKPSGRFYMVANRHLPYEDTLKATFGTGRLMGELEGYKLYEAAKPRR